jgi:hypothetical protein
MLIRANASGFALRGVLLTLFLGLVCGAQAQSDCFGQWQPASVSYLPPMPPQTHAMLSFGPQACALGFDDRFIGEVTVEGGLVTVRGTVFDTYGVGVPTPPANIMVPIPPLSEGTYQLTTDFLSNTPRVVNSTLPLVVSGTASPIPVDGVRLRAVLVGLVLLAAALWFRQHIVAAKR